MVEREPARAGEETGEREEKERRAPDAGGREVAR